MPQKTESSSPGTISQLRIPAPAVIPHEGVIRFVEMGFMTETRQDLEDLFTGIRGHMRILRPENREQSPLNLSDPLQ